MQPLKTALEPGLARTVPENREFIELGHRSPFMKICVNKLYLVIVNGTVIGFNLYAHRIIKR